MRHWLARPGSRVLSSSCQFMEPTFLLTRTEGALAEQEWRSGGCWLVHSGCPSYCWDLLSLLVTPRPPCYHLKKQNQTFIFKNKKKALLRYSSHTKIFILLKCTFQWASVFLQSFVTIITTYFLDIFIVPEGNPVPARSFSLFTLASLPFNPGQLLVYFSVSIHTCMLSCFSRVQLFAALWTVHGYSVHGILQARILEWVAMPFSRGSSWFRDWTSAS